MTDAVSLRPFAPGDLDALYRISLLTGDAGGDATPLHKHPRIIGDIYSAPYATLAPDWAFVAEDHEGVAGYVLGAPDTRAFESRLETEWWPKLRRQYPDPDGPPASWSADQLRAWIIHHPRAAPEDVVAAFPAHLHMNLHPRLQGRGVGPKLLEIWLARAVTNEVTGVHLGSNPGNLGALRFWGRSGFSRLERAGAKARSTVWFGRTLAVPLKP